MSHGFACETLIDTNLGLRKCPPVSRFLRHTVFKLRLGDAGMQLLCEQAISCISTGKASHNNLESATLVRFLRTAATLGTNRITLAEPQGIEIQMLASDSAVLGVVVLMSLDK
jgi:hypothetical protein